MRALCWAGVVLPLGLAAADPAVVRTGASELPPHPRLLFSADGLRAWRERVSQPPWDKEWQARKVRADQRLGEPVALPPRGGNWSHNYVCPTHGARLKQGKRVAAWEWEHICPVGPHTLRGDPSRANLDFDGNAVGAEHGDLAQQVLQHGLAYQVTGDARHAARGREILAAYARQYRQYPLHDNQGRAKRGAHVYTQSLTEASWLVTMAQGADLVWSALSEAERAAVTAGLFRSAVEEIILPAKLGIHNIQCWHNSAIGLVGFLLDDQALIGRAIGDPDRGYWAQMRKGVQADGVWCEGAWGYHFFTISGVWPLTEAARNCGTDLYGPEFKRLFDGPLALASPGFVLPAFNDSGEVSLGGQAELYELAYARYREPAYAALLRKSRRDGPRALWFGVTDLGGESAPVTGSRNAAASGYAVLQRNAGEAATWLCLKYGPHGGGHGHPDKLTFVLYAGDRTIMPDSGTKAYASPLHAGWDKTTYAHSTLVVNQASQAPAQGRCLAFGQEAGVDYVVAEAGPVYPDLLFVRAVAMPDPSVVVVVDQVRASGPDRQLDIACHLRGRWDGVAADEPWTPPAVPGLRYLQGGTRREVRERADFALAVSDTRRVTLSLAAGGTTEVVTATGVGANTEDRVPVALFRRSGTRSAFVWALTLDGATPVGLEVTPVRAADGRVCPADEAVAVRVSHAGRAWTLVVNPGGGSVRAVNGAGGEWATEQVFAVRE